MSATSIRSRLSNASTARNVLVGLAMAALVAVLVPLSLGYDAYHRVRSRRRAGRVEPLRRVRADEVDLHTLVDERSPIVIEGLATRLDLDDVAGLDALRAVAARRPEPLRVRYFDPSRPYFLYTGDYGATATSTERLPLGDLLDEMFTGDGPDDVVYQLLGRRDLDGEITTILETMGRRVESASGRPALVDASGVWVGSAGATTPLHHDSWPGLLFQTHGTKRVAMFAPADRPNLYFNFPLPVGSRWSRLPPGSAELDADEFPRAARVTRFEAVLEAGDALFIPPYWGHEMEALESNVSVPLRLRADRRGYLDPGFLRPAAEVMHDRWSRLVSTG